MTCARPLRASATVVVAVVVALSSACASDDGGGGASTSTTEARPVPTSTPPATSEPASALPLLEAVCASDVDVQARFELDPSLTSVSGLAASTAHTGTVWAVEDSFEPAELRAIDLGGGEVTGTATVEGGPFTNLDWEALSLDHADGSTLYVGDIGDNLGIRGSVRLYEVAEPDPTEDSTVEPRVHELRYDDGVLPDRPNAEALLVHDRVAWVLDKEPDGPATLYRSELPDGVGASQGRLEPIGRLDLGGEQATALDMSPDAAVLVLRTNRSVRWYRVVTAEGAPDVAATLSGEPCTSSPPPEPQGESAALLAGTGGLVTVSEDESGQPVELHLTSSR